MSDKEKKLESGGKEITRRQALKYMGAGVVGLGLAGSLLSSCAKRQQKISPEELTTATLEEDTVAAMSYRTDNVYGEKISLLGFGTMRYPTVNGKIDEEKSQELVDYAYQHGVNYFDTAYLYHNGDSELFTGKALKKYPRESFYLATKMPTWLVTDLASAKHLFEDQLRKCQVEYFDYYLLHSLRQISEYKKCYVDNGALEYLKAEKAAGRIKRLGFSFHGDLEGFEYLLNCGEQWDFVQIQMNYLDWYGPLQSDRLYAMLEEKGIQCIIMEPLRGGRLAKVNPVAADLLKKARPGDTPAEWAFRFVASYPNVLTILSGMTEMQYLQENINTLSENFKPLDEKEHKVVEAVANAINSYNLVPCTECDYCDPCPYGVDISGVFRHYNRCVNEGIIPDKMSQSQSEFCRKRREYLISYDKEVAKEAQANHCIGCGSCMQVCPQRFDIVANLRRIDKFVDSLKFHNTQNV